MAAETPDQAIWVVPDRATGHEVIRALNNPPTGPARLPRTYSDGTYLPRVDFDEDGFTDIYNIVTLRNRFLDEPADSAAD